ncbi:B12-binding domain-containing radical SAM protein [Candidatus Sumerlaeota bacterium]|nr:B12-binding domain-containing radical SAM protein [Candidatus Sumerlaeota bacterium]
MRILMVYPETPVTFWSLKYVLGLVCKRSAHPPLGLLTVAAMLPDDWEIKLIDMNVDRLIGDDIEWADYVMVSGMIIHRVSIHEIVARCHRLSTPVIAGGPVFATDHASFPDIHHFVLGEAEDLMPQLIEDMVRGTLKHTYSAPERPDITRVPIPRWDLIDLRHYLTMPIQFSRGCPFDCEFCDIVVMYGHLPRTKTTEQVVAEIDALHRHGWKDMIFLVDDNFIGNKKAASALLTAIIEWRARTGSRMGFLTEASVNLADDLEFCKLMVEAGFKRVFVGFESPSVESLIECRKMLNARRDLVQSVQRLQSTGLEVMGGFIVGFDNDAADIFRRQFEFIQRSGVVTAMVGLLNALPGTKLHIRLAKEGRLSDSDCTGDNMDLLALNFHPRMDRKALIDGYRALVKKLYEPRAYYDRAWTFLSNMRSRGPRMRMSWSSLEGWIKSIWLLGIWHPGRLAYWRFCAATLLRRPRQFQVAMMLSMSGLHFRRVANSL